MQWTNLLSRITKNYFITFFFTFQNKHSSFPRQSPKSKVAQRGYKTSIQRHRPFPYSRKHHSTSSNAKICRKEKKWCFEILLAFSRDLCHYISKACLSAMIIHVTRAGIVYITIHLVCSSGHVHDTNLLMSDTYIPFYYPRFPYIGKCFDENYSVTSRVRFLKSLKDCIPGGFTPHVYTRGEDWNLVIWIYTVDKKARFQENWHVNERLPLEAQF